jgi:prepilin-type N-terminal cleavage/methylation domain-containing protein
MKKIKAFSLLEIAIVLSIIGIMATSVVKGYQVMQNAKVQKTVTQIEGIKVAVDTYINTYNAHPGPSGTPDKEFWKNLEDAELINSSMKTPAVGGSFKYENHEIELSGLGHEPILSLVEANKIKAQIDGSHKAQGCIRIVPDSDQKKSIIYVKV